MANTEQIFVRKIIGSKGLYVAPNGTYQNTEPPDSLKNSFEIFVHQDKIKQLKDENDKKDIVIDRMAKRMQEMAQTIISLEANEELLRKRKNEHIQILKTEIENLRKDKQIQDNLFKNANREDI